MAILRRPILAALLLGAGALHAQEVPPLPGVEGPIAQQVGNLMHPSRRGPTLGQATAREWPAEREPAFFNYVEDEFFITGEANGAPYTTRFVFRHPAAEEDFSGTVLIETLHPAQSAQTWMASRVGGMLNGHGYVEVVNSPGLVAGLQGFNAARYAGLSIEGAVTAEGEPDPAQNEIIAQVAHLVRTANPLGEAWNAERLVMTGASATSRTAMNFMEEANGNAAWATEEGAGLIDGVFVWDTNGPDEATLAASYAMPTIVLATQTEWMANPDAPRSRAYLPDSDTYRLYQVAGAPHLEAREMPEAGTEACGPLDDFMLNAVVYLGVEHMHEWLEGTAPPMAPRIAFEGEADDAPVQVDEWGNALGGVRSPQLEVPTKTYLTPAGGDFFLCGLSGTTTPLSEEQLASLYDSPADYAGQLAEATSVLVAERWFPAEYLFEVAAEVERAGPAVARATAPAEGPGD